MNTDMNDPFNQQIDPELLVRFLSGDANEQEMGKVRKWMMADDRNKEYVDQLAMLWRSSQNAKDFASVSATDDWRKVRKRIDDTDKTTKTRQPHRQRSTMYQLARIAAAIFILITAYFAWPVLKGGWADTTTIVTTGNQSEIVLPDGSKVYINKNSSLTYSKDFDGKTREIELAGEAFFEVTKNDAQPFLVKSGQAVTEVAGTSFNVNSTVPTDVVVTVLTGKVFLYDKADRANKIIMADGEQGSFRKGKGLSRTVNRDINFLSWKTGALVFHHTSLSQVVNDLNRHYGQYIELASPALKNCTLTATFQQQKIEAVLAEMELVLPIQIQKKGNTFTIMGEGCEEIQ